MTATLEGSEWSAARLDRTLPPGKTRYQFYRRLGGPQGRSGRAENLVPTWIRSRTVQPDISRYSDWATRPIGIEEVGRKKISEWTACYCSPPYYPPIARILLSIVLTRPCNWYNSIEQSPSWKGSFSAIEEIPLISWNTRPCPELDQSSPCTAFNFLKINFNNIPRSMPRSSKFLFPSGFRIEILYALLLSPILATCPVHVILLDLITRKIFGKGYRSRSSSVCNLLHSPPSPPSRLTYFPQHPIVKQLCNRN